MEMPKQHTVYYSDEDEELVDWISEYSKVFGGPSNMHKRAMRVLRNEKGAEIESLADDENRDEIT